MTKFADPPVTTDFIEQGQTPPTDPWEKWFQAVSNALTAAPQGFSGTRAQRLKLTKVSTGSIAFETDTGHVLTWSGTAWIQLV